MGSAVAVRVPVYVVRVPVQRLMQAAPPAPAHEELVSVRVAGVIIMGDRDRHAIAVHDSIRVGEHQVAAAQVHTAFSSPADRTRIMIPVAFQTGQGGVFQLEVRRAARTRREEPHCVGIPALRQQGDAVIGALVPFPGQVCHIHLDPVVFAFFCRW